MKTTVKDLAQCVSMCRARQRPKESWTSPASPLLPPEAELEMLQKRLVKAERARAAAVANGAAEKRALRVQLMVSLPFCPAVWQQPLHEQW